MNGSHEVAGLAATGAGHAEEGSDASQGAPPNESMEAGDGHVDDTVGTKGESGAPADPRPADSKKLESPKSPAHKAKPSISVKATKSASGGPPTPLVKKVRVTPITFRKAACSEHAADAAYGRSSIPARSALVPPKHPRLL